jgi:hypothetical protein
MTKLEYNGYTNYETWNVNIHYSDTFYDITKDAVDNLDTTDEDFAEEFNLQELIDNLASTFEAYVWENSGAEGLPEGIAKEFVTDGLDQVDWDDIAETHLSDFDVLKPFWG